MRGGTTDRGRAAGRSPIAGGAVRAAAAAAVRVVRAAAVRVVRVVRAVGAMARRVFLPG